MNNLPRQAYSAADVREFDRRAIEDKGIPGFDLMQRAGLAAFDRLLMLWPRCKRLVVVCGPGNNAGDGYVVATLAHEAGMNVSVMALVPAKKLKKDAQLACKKFIAAQGRIVKLELAGLANADVIIDAVLGTGLQRNLSGDYETAVEAVNSARRPVLALDIPTGLNADTGSILGNAIVADATVTFIALKAGLLTGDGPAVTGELYYHALDAPNEIFTDTVPRLNILNPAYFSNVLVKRSPTAHKGDHGHVLIVGGNLGMPGAVSMSGEAALRTGAGLATVATRNENAATVNMTRPELMVSGVSSGKDLATLISRASVIALGPGLGRDKWAQKLSAVVMKTELPLVVDADGLNLLAERVTKRGNWILTPHPGEAARLLDTDSTTIQRDRIAAVVAIAKKYNAVVILKGAGSLVASNEGDGVACCRLGNPGMATAGMGDVLTGIVAGLLAQGTSLEMAAKFAVYVHATAGDAAAGKYQRGLLATDLMPHIRKQVSAF